MTWQLVLLHHALVFALLKDAGKSPIPGLFRHHLSIFGKFILQQFSA